MWKLWVRYITGGAAYRPSFAAMFLDPLFVQCEVVPADLPVGGYAGYNPFVLDPVAPPATPPPAPTTGFGNAPAIVPANAPDLPWIPSIQFRAGVRNLMPEAAPVFSVLVLNDQTDWFPEARAAVEKAVAARKGFVVFHHALGDNQPWPRWYRELLGGHMALTAHDGLRKTTVTPGITLDVKPVGPHPIVQGIGPLRLVRETAYKGMWQAPGITPLLETASPGSDKVVAWVGPDPNVRVVCIQPGAASETHRNPAFRKLVRNAILWAGGRLD